MPQQIGFHEGGTYSRRVQNSGAVVGEVTGIEELEVRVVADMAGAGGGG